MVLYNNDYILTYFDAAGNNDEQFKQDFLAVFNINTFDYEQINAQIDEIYKSIVEYNPHHPLLTIAKQTASVILSDEPSLGFLLLFSYQYFYYMHQCMIEWNTTRNITTASLNTLKSIIDMDIK